MKEDSEDRLIRHLKRSTREEVYSAIIEYKNSLSKRSSMYEPKLRRILYDHGWTFSEYIKSSNTTKTL